MGAPVSWLFSEKTPALLTVLVAILTWQVGQIIDEVRSGKAIVYSQDEEDGYRDSIYSNEEWVRIANPSRTQPTGEFKFTLACKKPDCLTGKARPRLHAPTSAIVRIEEGNNSDQSTLIANLAPGAVVWLVAETSAPGGIGEALTEPRFYSGSDLTLRVVKSGTTEALLLEGWLDLLFLGLKIVGVAFVVWLLGATVAAILRWNSASGQSQGGLAGTVNLQVLASQERLNEMENALSAKIEALSDRVTQSGEVRN